MRADFELFDRYDFTYCHDVDTRGGDDDGDGKEAAVAVPAIFKDEDPFPAGGFTFPLTTFYGTRRVEYLVTRRRVTSHAKIIFPQPTSQPPHSTFPSIKNTPRLPARDGSSDVLQSLAAFFIA